MAAASSSRRASRLSTRNAPRPVHGHRQDRGHPGSRERPVERRDDDRRRGRQARPRRSRRRGAHALDHLAARRAAAEAGGRAPCCGGARRTPPACVRSSWRCGASRAGAAGGTTGGGPSVSDPAPRRASSGPPSMTSPGATPSRAGSCRRRAGTSCAPGPRTSWATARPRSAPPPDARGLPYRALTWIPTSTATPATTSGSARPAAGGSGRSGSRSSSLPCRTG